MSKQDETKKSSGADTPDTQPENVSAADALKEIAGDLAASEAENAAQADGEKSPKKKKRERTPEQEKERALNAVKRRKKLKYGTLATVITLVFIAIVVVINVICNVLDSRYNWNIDLTSSGLYEIDEQTVNYLHQLNSDIEIAVMADESYFLENARLKVLSETLNRFKAESNGHISVDYYDLTKNPDVANRYTQYYNGELSQADVVVKCGELVRVAPFDELIKINNSIDPTTYQQTQNITFIGEQTLVSAIMGVTDLNPVKVAVIDKTNGADIFFQYDAYNFQTMRDLLEKNNYNVTEVDLAADELSADYDLAILCAPYNDLTDTQIEKLTSYLNNDGQYGKDLLYFASPFQQTSLPKLDAFLELWGLKIDNALIYDANTATAQQVITALNPIQGVPTVTASDDALNAGYTATKLPIVAPLSRAVIPLFDQNAGRTTAALLNTSETCYRNPISEEEEADTSDQNAYSLAVLATTTFNSGSDTYSSRLIAFGSAWLLDYYVAGSGNTYDNAAYFVQLLNTVTGKESVLTIAEKSLDLNRVSITDAQAIAIRNITVLIIPLVVAVIGIVVYLRRRNK